MNKVTLTDKLAQFDDHWSPRIVAEFHWHSHPDTDDFFLVVQGRVAIDLPAQTLELDVGDLFVVPAGVAHRPRALSDEAAVLLIEPKGTPNTGDPATAAPKPRL